MSAATSTQWSEVFRETSPRFAASDIVAKTLVTYAATAAGDWAVVPVTAATQEVVGVARDDQAGGSALPVTVYDGPGSILRVVAGATVYQGQTVGFNGTATETHPVSGNVVTYPLVGPVSGASGSNVQRAGVSLEFANPNEQFAFYLSPRQLSGLV